MAALAECQAARVQGDRFGCRRVSADVDFLGSLGIPVAQPFAAANLSRET